jgi:deoxyribonucleoside regulator
VNTRYDPQLLFNVSKMYFLDGKKQEEIAKEVKVSRSSISLILSEAKEAGIVEITVHNPHSNNTELSATICTAFGIRECFVIPTALTDSDLVTQLVAERAVSVFNAALKDTSCVGIAWGRTCYHFMNAYHSERHPLDVHVFPLLGGTNRYQRRFHLNEMVRDFSEKIPATPHFIHAPVLAETVEDYDLYMRSSSLKAIVESWKHIDIAVISVGSPPEAANRTRLNTIPGHDFSGLHISQDAAGDICGRYFTEKGSFIEDDIAGRSISISPKSLKEADTVLCVVAGLEKGTSIIGALKTGLIDILIIDEKTAEAVLSLMPKK